MVISGQSGARWRQIAEQIESEIWSGARPPGSKLPSVAEQDAASGVSQTTTLRAYRELIAKGLAFTVHGRGTFVADPLPVAEESVPTLIDHEERIRALEDRLARIEHPDQ